MLGIYVRLKGKMSCGLSTKPSMNRGTTIEILDDKADTFLVVQLDDAMSPTLCFLKDGKASFQIPFDEMASIYSPRSFHGKSHYVHVRRACNREIANYRDMALNPYDQKQNKDAFPSCIC